MNTLVRGDIVDIILPASGCTREEYDEAIGLVKEFGLNPRYRSFADVVAIGLCANSVDYRFAHLMEALEAPDSKAVWCLKGGYGSQQLLPRLDEVVDAPSQKIFIGFSDITILLNYFADKWGWTCLHGPMPIQAGKVTKDTWQHLADIVFGEVNEVKFTAKPMNNAAKMPGVAEGRFLGGCASLMQALIGTSHMPDLTGAVLLLEDDKFETPRRIDRILDHLHRAGSFYELEAVVLGNFLEGKGTGSKDELELNEVLENLAASLDECGVPLIQNTRLGHSDDMLTVPIGAIATVNLGDEPEVIFK